MTAKSTGNQSAAMRLSKILDWRDGRKRPKDAAAWLIDIPLPDEPLVQRMGAELREQWLDVFEALDLRGCPPSQAASALGMPRATATHWYKLARERVAASVNKIDKAALRLKLSRRMEEVELACLDEARKERDPEIRIKFRKIAVDANKRQSEIWGLDSIEVKVDTPDNAQQPASLGAALRALGLEDADLSALGRTIAQRMSQQQKAAIDAELESEKVDTTAALEAPRETDT
uniref:Uncharacterized protein n=1 Tax=uncultured Caudovirales phage TaxID=2100421 RepID=A0A6J5L2N4_9CAUD|nr:hypothetical protein UFOVP114_82 [uncultured Caudovirales phage]